MRLRRSPEAPFTIRWTSRLEEPLPAVPLTHFQAPVGVEQVRRQRQTPHCLGVRDERGHLVATWVLSSGPGDPFAPPRRRLSAALDLHLQSIHGPVLAGAAEAADRDAARRACLRAVRRRARRLAPLTCTLTLDPLLDEAERAAWIAAAADCGFEAAQRFTYYIDLPPTRDDLLAAIRPDRRTKIRKAERAGVEFAHRDDAAGLRDYHEVRNETRRRTGFEPIPWEWFAATAEAFRGTSVFHVFTASAEGRCGAAQLAYVWHGYVFLVGVSVADWTIEERVPANDLLQFNVLDWARAHGCRTVDFVGAHPGSDDPKIRAIDSFKSRWGTTLGESLELSLPGSTIRRRAFRIAQVAAA